MQKKRLFPFIFGLLLGIFFLMILYKDRKFTYFRDYLPEGRVIADIRTKKINSAVVLLKENENLVDSTIFNQFLTKASVDFSKSATSKKPCPEYYIYTDSLGLTIKNCENDVYIMKVENL